MPNLESDSKMLIATNTLNASSPYHLTSDAYNLSPMKSRGISQPEVTAFVRHWIDQQTASGHTKNGLAVEIGLSGPHLNNISTGKTGVGVEVEQLFADKITGGSVDKLRQKARAFCADPSNFSRLGHPARESPNWRSMSAQAKLKRPKAPKYVWDLIAKLPIGSNFDTETLIQLADSFAATAERLRAHESRTRAK
jgi:hypothetical protein